MVKVKEDLTGKTFGRLRVLKQAEDIVGKSGQHHSAWICLCECGNTKIINGVSLKAGRTQSCGCLQKDVMAKNSIDMVGKKYGRLTVIERADDYVCNSGNEAQWLCECECGNKVKVIGSHLRSGVTKSCGCLRREKCAENGRNTLIDLTGMIFGKLTVLNRAETVNLQTMWNCRCSCGKELKVTSGHLKDGHTQSCGCYNREISSRLWLNDLTGQTFGELTVIERAPNRRIDETYWRCRCSCGKELDVCAAHLRSGKTLSCGCKKTSKGEMLVAEYLSRNQIAYEREYKFVDCVDKKELPFDFYIPSLNTLIEVQGQQHYEPVDFAGEGVSWAQEQFATVQKHDKIKRDYCDSHKMNLIYIPYWEYDNIETILRNLS